MMSFSRAVIKRFNERSDNSIPPPGTYDPRFETDCSEKARLGLGKARSPRRKSTTSVETRSRCEIPVTGKREPRSITRFHNKVTTATPSITKSRLSIISSRMTKVTASNVSFSPSVSPVQPLKALPSPRTRQAIEMAMKKTLRKQPKGSKDILMKNLDANDNPNLSEITEVYKHDGEFEYRSVIQEIQDMAENLQIEIVEYKRRLSEEIIRGNELDSKKRELELEIQSLNRELRKHESAKESCLQSEASLQRQLEELSSTKQSLEEATEAKLKLEKEKHDLEAECKRLQQTELTLKEKIDKLEADTSLRERGMKLECEKALQLVQVSLKEEESRRKGVEERCKILLAQLVQCFGDNSDTLLSAHAHDETGITDAENITNLYEEKLRELTEQKEVLKKELNVMRQELEEGKVLMELTEAGDALMNSDYKYKYVS